MGNGSSRTKTEKSTSLGAALGWNWKHPEQNHWSRTLDSNHSWDAITLLAWSGDDEVYATNFAAEAFKGNPQCRVFLYTIWPDAQMNWENPDPIRTEAHTERLAAALEKAFPDKPKPRVISAAC